MEIQNSKFKKVSYSYKDGLNFFMGDESIHLRVQISSLTNERTFYFNEKIIAKEGSLKSLKRKSTLAFSECGINYEVELFTESFISGRIRCTLIRDGIHFSTALFNARTWESDQKSPITMVKESILGCLVGGVIGYFITTSFIL
jgi:hypothetical protein